MNDKLKQSRIGDDDDRKSAPVDYCSVVDNVHDEVIARALQASLADDDDDRKLAGVDIIKVEEEDEDVAFARAFQASLADDDDDRKLAGVDIIKVEEELVAFARALQASFADDDDDDDRKPAAVDINNSSSNLVDDDEAFARALQASLTDDHEAVDINNSNSRLGDDDEAIASALQASLTDDHAAAVDINNSSSRLVDDDEVIARAFQASLTDDSVPSYRVDEALLLLSKLNDLLKMLVEKFPTNSAFTQIKAVVPLSASLRILQCQEAFDQRHKPSAVRLSYHFTKKAFLPSIQEYGLLTKKERRNVNISSEDNGSTHGDGVYLADSIWSTDHHHNIINSDTGLIVACLRGDVEPIRDADADSEQVTGFVVVRRSSQCVPLVEFPAAFSSSENQQGAAALRIADVQLAKLVDKAFNHRAVLDRRMVSKKVRQKPSECSQYGIKHIKYEAPEKLNGAVCIPVRTCNHPDGLGNCPICLRPLVKNVVEIKACGHMFCSGCLKQTLSNARMRCPACRKRFGTPQGMSPSGEMAISMEPSLTCSGFPPGSYVIRYSFEAGKQKVYHPNPGGPYRSTTRTAYIPTVPKGEQLLRRLVFAWKHGLFFTVGTSPTTSEPNDVTWVTVHQKTKPAGGKGSHGFYPDDDYFLNANEELDALGVPQAEDFESLSI